MNNDTTRFHSIEDERALRFYQVPKILFENPKYEKLSLGSKMVYSILRDRQELSIKNNWIDENGHIYLIFTNDDLMSLLQSSEKTLIKYKRELEKTELIINKRMGLNRANRLYVLKPEQFFEKMPKSPKSLDTQGSVKSTVPVKSTELKKVQFKNSKKYSSRTEKSTVQELEKIQPNDTDFKDTDFKDTELSDYNQDLDLINEELFTMKLPFSLKKYFSKMVKVLVNDTFDIAEVEEFYNSNPNLIVPDCKPTDIKYLNDSEFSRVVKKAFENAKRPINNSTYGLIKSWVSNGISYKKERTLDSYLDDTEETIEDIDFFNNPLADRILNRNQFT